MGRGPPQGGSFLEGRQGRKGLTLGDHLPLQIPQPQIIAYEETGSRITPMLKDYSSRKKFGCCAALAGWLRPHVAAEESPHPRAPWFLVASWAAPREDVTMP